MLRIIMTTQLVVATARLSDEELLERVHALATRECATTAVMVAHLAEFDR